MVRPFLYGLNHYIIAHCFCWVVWQSQSSWIEAQQDDQLELQITLQEVIDMIDISAQEETMADHGRPEKTMVDHGEPEETMADHGRPEETMADEDLQWFDWVV